MKKGIISIAILLVMVGISACVPTQQPAVSTVSPYEFTAQEQRLLQTFGIDNRAAVFSFAAPEQAITLDINAYYLADGIWQPYGGGAVSIGIEREPVELLNGMVSVLPQEEYVFKLGIDCGGSIAHYTTEPLKPDIAEMASTWALLDNPKEIVLDEEIPVALYVYDDGYSIYSHNVEEYFTPNVLADMNLVQAITLTFSSKSLD